MYRIEVTPGEESVFRTIEELAIGIRNGVITPRARIFHQASQKWLPIGLHPHYKKALEMPAASVSPAPVTATTPLPAPVRPKAQPHQPSPSEPRPVASFSPGVTELKIEPKVEPKPPAPDRIPGPTPSPIVAMQREVLRDLPVLLIPEPSPRSAPLPEPLPWQMPVPRVSQSEETSRRLAPHAFGPPRVAPHPEARHPVPRPVAHHPGHHPLTEHFEIPADDALLPRPTARRAPRMGGRPLMLFGAAATLVIGTHFALTTTPSASADPVAAAAPAEGSEPVEASPEVAPPSRSADAPRVTTAPARVAMTPGPAFAGSVAARPGADSMTAKAAGLTAPPPAAATEEPMPSIAPAPMAGNLTLPDLPPDSVVGTRRTGDTLAMKKILRAINGDQASEASTER